MDRFFDRAGPFTDESLFAPGDDTKEFVRHYAKILVVGAGGLGCELLKNLALSGFADIHVIDMDTIDLSNLNRQFLFRAKDIGRPKATVAAEFINSRIPHVTVTPHYCKIQDKDTDFYEQFHLVITGLDSVDARRWINATIVGMSDPDDPSSAKPIVDGGTEGFKGQARVILPRQNACYECSLDMFTKPTAFPMCTIANTPRLPEHCVAWAFVLQWPKLFPDTKLDGDNPEHITWVTETARQRAEQYGIRGVTYTLAQGVVKNIIPAIASTNAVISAACTTEAIKLVTACQPPLDNYMMYTGNESVYTFTFPLQRKPDCPVCGAGKIKLAMPSIATVQDLLDSCISTSALSLASRASCSLSRTMTTGMSACLVTYSDTDPRSALVTNPRPDRAAMTIESACSSCALATIASPILCALTA
ncbi:hypothetical protein BC828DRAFT_411263 [Blastocladiella britannica]|nr:hypothetical protein BC828DRAFT_411263 [Blastocladiella britannica]